MFVAAEMSITQFRSSFRTMAVWFYWESINSPLIFAPFCGIIVGLGSDLLVREMSDLERCPECGAVLHDGETCEAYFHQMLFWEAENPANGEVHHLAVLCYHLQHPHL